MIKWVSTKEITEVQCILNVYIKRKWKFIYLILSSWRGDQRGYLLEFKVEIFWVALTSSPEFSTAPKSSFVFGIFSRPEENLCYSINSFWGNQIVSDPCHRIIIQILLTGCLPTSQTSWSDHPSSAHASRPSILIAHVQSPSWTARMIRFNYTEIRALSDQQSGSHWYQSGGLHSDVGFDNSIPFPSITQGDELTAKLHDTNALAYDRANSNPNRSKYANQRPNWYQLYFEDLFAPWHLIFKFFKCLLGILWLLCSDI